MIFVGITQTKPIKSGGEKVLKEFRPPEIAAYQVLISEDNPPPLKNNSTKMKAYVSTSKFTTVFCD